MKFIKNVLVIIVFFIPIIMNAKQTGVKMIPVQTTLPAPQPKIAGQPPKQPVLQQQSYANALNIIRNQMPAHQILHNNQFSSEFINFVKDSIKDSDYPDIFTKALLEAGGYLYAILTGNQQIDNDTLMNIKNQIDRQMNLLFPTKIIKPNIEQKDIPYSAKSGVYPEFVEGKGKQQITQTYHLIPVNKLQEFKLCPLFDQRVLNKEEKELANQLKKEGHTQESIMRFLGKVAPHYSVFNEHHIMESGETGP